jgi:hypothetical protein
VFTLSAAVMLLIDVAQRNSGQHVVMLNWRAPIQGITYAGLGLSVLLWSGGLAQPFIYFQF